MGVPASAAAERRKVGAPPKWRAAAPEHRQTATFVDAARHMTGMRLSALRLPVVAGANLFWSVVGTQSSGA
jgi:hypothetical protein